MSTTIGSEVTTTAHAGEKHAEVSRSYLIFLIVIFLVMLFITGVLIANTVYFSEIRKNGCGTISANEGNIMFWINLVLAIIAGIILIVSFVLMWFAYKKPEYTEKYLGTYKKPTVLTEAQKRAVEAHERVTGAAVGARLGFQEPAAAREAAATQAMLRRAALPTVPPSRRTLRGLTQAAA